MVTDDELSELVARVARWALAAKCRLVTAESCTGGWIAKVTTDVAGSSRWFECGYVTYSNAAKLRDLGVSERTLEEHGTVSEATVREMARGAGIAGPDGGSAEKPVGTGLVLCGAARRVRRRLTHARLRRASKLSGGPTWRLAPGSGRRLATPAVAAEPALRLATCRRPTLSSSPLERSSAVIVKPYDARQFSTPWSSSSSSRSASLTSRLWRVELTVPLQHTVTHWIYSGEAMFR